MKNLKKVTALVIVLAMALTSVGFAATFTDVAEDASYNEAVQVMSSLGLLVGDPEGTFRPDDTITRAEFAAVIVRALGMEDAAAGASANTVFTDVPADHWSSGYVQIANQRGIILGYGDGTFGPDNPVLYEEAVKMIECALGYDVKFKNVPDAYPTNYLAQANADGITVGASGKIGDQASRAIVSRLVYNSLTVPLMEQTSFGGIYGDEYTVNENTSLLYNNLKVAKVEANIEKLFFNKDQSDEVSLDITMYDELWGDVVPSTVSYAEGLDVASMRGYSCVAYIDMSDDSEPVLKAIAPKAGRNRTLELTKKQVNAVDFANNEISYFRNDSNDDKDVKVRLDSNFENSMYLNLSTSSMSKEEFADLFENPTSDFTTIKLIENNNDNRYDLAIVEKYGSFVVESVNERNYTIYGNGSAEATYDSYRVQLDPDDDTISYSIKDKDGNAMEITDIQPNNVANIAVSEDGGDTYYDIIITDTIVSGIVNERNTSNGVIYYVIDGVEYKVANNATDIVNIGDEGSFIVDMSGNILYKTEAVSGGANDFGFIVGLEGKAEFGSYTYRASVMNQQGEFSTLDFASKVRLNGDSQKEIKYNMKLDENEDLVLDDSVTVGSNEIGFDKIYALNKDLVGYKINSSGQISQLFATTDEDIKAMNNNYFVTKSKDLTYKGDGQLGSYFVTDDTNIFAVDVDSEAGIATSGREDLNVVKASALVEDQTYGFKTIVSDGDGNIIALLGYDITATADPISAAMIVTRTGQRNDSNGDPATSVTGLVNGESVTIVVPDDAKIEQAKRKDDESPAIEYSAEDITQGFVIQYSADSNGEASGVSVLLTKDQLMDTDTITNIDPANQDDDLFIFADSVYDVSTSRVLFRTKDDDDANISVAMRGSVPVVQVIKNSDGTDIRTIRGDAMLRDVETDKRNPDNLEANTDEMIVVKYDNVPIIAVILTFNN